MSAEHEALMQMVDQMRASYGLPAEPRVPPTLQEMIAAQGANSERLIRQTLVAFARTRKATEPHSVWYSAATHKRDLPEFAYFTITNDCWTPEAAADLASMAWTMPEWPAQIGVDPWLEIFEHVEPMCDNTDEDQDCEDCPLVAADKVTVYRGAFSSEKRGLSWTTSRERAQWFADRGDMAGKGRVGRVWECDVPVDRVLAHFTSRGEDEVVANVKGLRIRQAVNEEVAA